MKFNGAVYPAPAREQQAGIPYVKKQKARPFLTVISVLTATIL